MKQHEDRRQKPEVDSASDFQLPTSSLKTKP